MLIGFDLLRQLVKSIILTGRLTTDHPVSLLLIAPPEQGKTSIVTEDKCESIMIFSDITGRGIQQVCKMKPEITHFVINDLVAVMSHRQSVANFTISQLSAMAEEGLQATAYPNDMQTYDHGRRGVIASLTNSMAKDNRNWWNKTGFASRMLPFAFVHSDDLKTEIHNYIKNGKHEKGHVNKLVVKQGAKEIGKIVFDVPEKPVAVTLPPKHAEYIQKMSMDRARILGETGYRRHKQYRALARGHALSRTFRNPTVTEADLQFILQIDKYVSFQTCHPL